MALTVTFVGPFAALGRVEMVRLVLTELPDGVTVAGLKAHVMPGSAPGQLKLTCDVNAPSGATVTAIGPVLCPATTLALLELNAKAKLGAAMFKLKNAFAKTPLEVVPVTVMLFGPTSVLAKVETVRFVVPLAVAVSGLKLHDAPEGKPEQAKVTTVPLKRALSTVRVTVLLAVFPAEIFAGVSAVADSWNPGAVAQAVARFFKSTEPRPVTRLYPVVGSEFEAL